MFIIKMILLIVNIVTFVATALFAIFDLYEQIVGTPCAERLLEMLHIPLSFNQFLIIQVICVVLMIISLNLRLKLSGKL